MTFLNHNLFIDIKKYNYTLFDLLYISDNLMNVTVTSDKNIDKVRYMDLISKITASINEYLLPKLLKGYKLDFIGLVCKSDIDRKGPMIQVYNAKKDLQSFREHILENAKSLPNIDIETKIDYNVKQQYYLGIILMRAFALTNYLKNVVREQSLINISDTSKLEFLINLIKI